MKFIIERASALNVKEKPCEDAIKIKHQTFQRFWYKSPEEYDKRFGEYGRWFSEGTNHRINEQGNIERDMDIKEFWEIEINSLADLIEFQNTYGEIIIQDSTWVRDIKTILIYDDYIE